ncbi:MAG: PAS domain-containing protein [Asgard group archaeon]|nr:PAS domain-containing protein [Asgard group archaeon]
MEKKEILEKKIEQLTQEIMELKQFKEDILTILEPLNALIFLVDKDGNYLKVSPTCPESLLVLPREELEGQNMRDVFP